MRDLSRLGELDPSYVPAELPKLGVETIAALARELAMNMRREEHILEDYKITTEQFRELKKSKFFQNTYDAYVVEWNSAMSTKNRIEIQAATLLEQALPVMGSKMLSAVQPLKEQVEAGKMLAKICGLGEKMDSGDNKEKFVINIKLGADTHNYVKDITPVKTIEHESEDAGA
jgi:hypothetical protein